MSPDGLREIVRAVMQEMLEAEMTDALAAEKGERTAETVERIVLDAIGVQRTTHEIKLPARSPSAKAPRSEPDANAPKSAERIAADVDRITLRSHSIEILLRDGSDREAITIPWTPHTLRRKREIIQPSIVVGRGRSGPKREESS